LQRLRSQLFSPNGWVNFSASDPLVFWIAFAI
jgi:hypothetical protein